jgi:protein gp37
MLSLPATWKAPRRIFVNSMSDLFHPAVPDEFINRVFATIAMTPRHTYQILTKRPQRVPGYLRGERGRRGYTLAEAAGRVETSWPLPNVWLGTSIESDRFTFRADHLRRAPAVIRFLSLEPLLGPLPSLDLTGIDWVIVGGESGHHFRSLDLGWVRDIRDRCVEEGIAFFFKQVGGRTPKAGGRQLDGQTWNNIPTRTAPDVDGTPARADRSGPAGGDDADAFRLESIPIV